MPKIRVALYIRVSTDKQADHGMSLDAQQAELRRFAAERGWEIADCYIDGGFSAKSTDRPAYQKMLADIKAGRINAIVVTKLDRLTRSVRNLCEINEDVLRPLNINLVCVRDGINTFEVGSSLLMHLLAVIGQIERENTSNRVAAAIRHIQDQGGHYGKVPFGSMTVPHPTQPKMRILVEHPEESVWLKRIFAWYAEGKRNTEIAKLLNAEGIKPRCGKDWSVNSVYEILCKHGVHKARPIDSPKVYDREKAFKLAMDMRQDERTFGAIAKMLSANGLRPKNAAEYSVSAVQDLLRGSIYHNIKTAKGYALHLEQQRYSLRAICDKLLAAGFPAPRGGRWYPATLRHMMNRDDDAPNQRKAS